MKVVDEHHRVHPHRASPEDEGTRGAQRWLRADLEPDRDSGVLHASAVHRFDSICGGGGRCSAAGCDHLVDLEPGDDEQTRRRLRRPSGSVCRGPKLKASRNPGTVSSTMTSRIGAAAGSTSASGCAARGTICQIDSRHDRFTRMSARFPTTSVANVTERTTSSGSAAEHRPEVDGEGRGEHRQPLQAGDGQDPRRPNIGAPQPARGAGP